MRRMRIAVINQSTNVSDLEVFHMTSAVQKQITQHVAPAWSAYTARLSFFPGTEPDVPESYYRVVFLNDPDMADAAGYHWETPEGYPYSRVFTKFGGVSGIFSHEIIEMFLDPDCNRFAVDFNNDTLYAVEGCDAVERDEYLIDDVPVSNFILPAWFDRTHQSGARFDYMGKLTEPFTMTPGGYLIYIKGGPEQQRFGFLFENPNEAPPKELKWFPASRTVRKLTCAEKVVLNAP